MFDNIFFLIDRIGYPISKDNRMLRKIPRELGLVELPQTRAEVVAVDCQAVVHIIEKLRESV